MTLALLVTYCGEGELLRECLESATAGPEQPDEIVVYDDASRHPAADYVPKGFRGDIIRGTTNLGPSHARNVLSTRCRCEFVHYHDADDLMLPGWVFKTRKALDLHSPDLLLTQVSFTDQSGTMHKSGVPLHILRHEPDLIRFCLEYGIWTQNGTIRRELLASIGGFDETLWHNEDADVYLRLAIAGAKYHVLDESLVVNRWRDGSLSTHKTGALLGRLVVTEKASRSVPRQYYQLLCELAAINAVELYRAGLTDEANRASALACTLGRPTFDRCGRRYSRAARLLGWKTVEELRRIRRYLRGQETHRPALAQADNAISGSFG
jgi:glycosyltransferase involved in cell wall biosynthesis